jgi:multidrug efflux pump subunit AcrA (membrane-fusion protein)
MSTGKSWIKVLGVTAVVVAGIAGTATLNPDLYKRWVKPGGAGAADDGSSASGLEPMRYARAKRGDLRLSVSEEGKLRAVKSHRIFPQLRGSSRITFLAPEGSTVKKGDMLVTLDKKAYEDQVLTVTAELAAAQRALAIAEAAVLIQERSGASAVKLAQTKLEEAAVSRKTYSEMEGPQKLNKTESDMNEARGKLTEAQKKLSEAQRKLDDELFSDEEQRRAITNEFEAARENARTLKNTVESLIVQRKIFRAYEYPSNMKNKMFAVENAELEVKKAEVAAKNELQQKKEEVQKQKDIIERQTRQLNDLKEEITRCELRAPVDGLVVYGDPDGRIFYGQQIQVGSEWYGSNTIMTIPDLSAFEIDFQIAEEYRGRLVEGATADVTIEAVPGLRLKGKLTKVGQLARPRVQYDPSSPKVFDGTVTPASHDPRMVSGMTARIEIVTEELKDALHVPIESVFNHDGKPVCYVRKPNGQGVERREVKPGKSNDHFVEIADGLREGEEVQLFAPSDLAGGGASGTNTASPAPAGATASAAPKK